MAKDRIANAQYYINSTIGFLSQARAELKKAKPDTKVIRNAWSLAKQDLGEADIQLILAELIDE